MAAVYQVNDEALKKVKHFILNYESVFKTIHGHKPTKEDIKSDPKVLNYYKFYWKSKELINGTKNDQSASVVNNEALKKHQETNDEHGDIRTTAANETRVWSKVLNKKETQTTHSKHHFKPKDDLKRFMYVSERLKEKFVESSLGNAQSIDKSTKQTHYSLRRKHEQILIKGKQIAEENKLVAKTKVSVEQKIENNFVTLEPVIPVNVQCDCNDEPPQAAQSDSMTKVCMTDTNKEISSMIHETTHEPPAESALKLLENIINGTTSQTCSVPKHVVDAENDYTLDNVNEYIKESIIDKEKVFRISSADKQCETAKKRVFDLDDDSLYTINKRIRKNYDGNTKRVALSELPNIKRNFDLKSNASANQPSSHAEASKTPTEPTTISVTAQQTKKFFKSGTIKQVEYQKSNFLDFGKNDEFEFVDDSTAYNVPKRANKDDQQQNEMVNTLNDEKLDKIAVKKNTNTKKTPKADGGVKKKQTEKSNFKRLQMKKKSFARGHKKFNIRQYKFKQNRNAKQKYGNKCFRCNESGHFASSCPQSAGIESNNKSDISSNIDEIIDEQTEKLNLNLGINKPLFDNTTEGDQQLEKCIEEARQMFGIKEFRPNQKETIRRILMAQSTLLVMPTGSGKSLCYQLAAYCFAKIRGFITIVVSPLISLMQDQIVNFPKPVLDVSSSSSEIEFKPVCINSSQSEKEREASIDAIQKGHAHVLFISPEFITGGGMSVVKFATFPPVGFVCIDEAHCLAEWSTNFRPSYLHLYKVIHDKFNIKTILAMTATMTAESMQMICKHLALDPTQDVVGSTRVPSNLILSVSKSANKLEELIALLTSEPFNELKSIIIYCTKRDQTERLETQLRTLMQFHVPTKSLNKLVRAYHAGQSAYARAEIQKQFMSGKLRIVVATIAFGMGINKADIRGVIHYNMPKSFENYLQEIGRAGRDGQPAYCHMLLDTNGEDLFALQNYIYANGMDKCNIRKLVSKIYQHCKCNLLLNAASGDVEEVEKKSQGDDDDNSPVLNEKSSFIGPCKGHLVALPIAPTELEIDIKSESIYTLLMCLELNYSKAPIQMYSPINSVCTIVNFNGTDLEEERKFAQIVKQSPVLQAAIALHKLNVSVPSSASSLTANDLKFCVVKVASMLGMEVNQVKSELKKLEWTTDPVSGRRKKTHFAVRFSEYSYFFRAPGNLLEQQLNEVVTFLYENIEQYEAKEIYKLRAVYSKFHEFILPSIAEKDKLDKQLAYSDNLKQFINQYFDLTSANNQLDMDCSKLSLPNTFSQQSIDITSLRLDISNMIDLYYEQGLNTPRKIARILQGISSPEYPVQIWGGVRRYWRSITLMDFRELMSICHETLRMVNAS